jgi:DnaJ-class molecular chaperone
MTPGTGTCDGCDREGPVQQLEEVILPSGSMVVCPECRYHAEELAERSRADCEGCDATVTAADLVRTELPDGVELLLCPDCQESVSAGERPDGAPDAENSGSSDGATAANGESTAKANGGATPGATGSNTADTNASASSETPGGSSHSAASASDTTANAGDAVTDGATGKPATTQNACDQCGGLFSIELYQVVTVDGRREEFCPDCKDEGLEEGIVRDVELRRAQAYEVLGLADTDDPDDVRGAYLERVKQVHPDRSDGDRTEFMLVQQAYERLREE